MNLNEITHQEMLERGFLPAFPENVIHEAQSLQAFSSSMDYQDLRTKPF